MISAGYWMTLCLGFYFSGLVEPEMVSFPIHAESARVSNLTLEEVLERGTSANPVLRQTAAEIEVSLGRAVQAGLYPNPIASGGTPQWGGSESQFYGQLSQEIITKGKRRLDRDAAYRQVTQAELLFVQVRFELLTDLRREFYATLAGQERVRVLEQLVQVAQQSEKFVRSLEKVGEGTRAELLLIEIEREKAEVGLENARVLLEASRRQLAARMGTPEFPLQSVEGDLKAQTQDYSRLARDSGLLNDNASVQRARVEVERARIQLQRAIVEPFPNVTLSGGYMHEATFPNHLGLVAVEFPLPVWNRNQGNVRSARGEIVRSSEAVLVTFNRLCADMAGAMGRLEAASQQVKRIESAILPKAAESLAITQKAYEGGQVSILTLLQAQRSNAEAELGYVNVLEAKWAAAAEVAGLLQMEVFP